MNTRRHGMISSLCSIVVLVGLQFVVTGRAAEQALTNADVIALVKAGLGDQVVLAKIKQAEQVAFDVSPGGLVSLKNEGVSPAIIQAMMEREDKLKKKDKKKRRDAPPEIVKVTAKLPTLAPMPETIPTQEKGGIKISVAPVTYQVKPDTMVEDRPANPSFSERLFRPENAVGFGIRVYTPVLRVVPDRLRFSVLVSNQMPRVFHGAGTIVQFNVAGKLVAVDNEGYAALRTAIIPPRSEQQVEIYGPPLDTLPDQGTIGLFMYDVVTNTDTAGNVTEKQNFEWFFQYAVQLVEQEMSVSKPERLWYLSR